MATPQDKKQTLISGDGQHDSGSNKDNSAQEASFATTEHFTLQSASAATITESSGRTSLFLTTISGTLIALSFIGQASQMGAAFFVFAFVLFPSLYFIGLVTFIRTLDTAMQNNVYIRGMNRIRHYYLDNSPNLRRYFILSPNDDWHGTVVSVGLVGDPDAKISRFMPILLTTAGMVAVINSVLAGIFFGMVFRVVLGLFITLDANDWVAMLVSALVGLMAFGISVFLHFRYMNYRWTLVDKYIKVEFPEEGQS